MGDNYYSIHPPDVVSYSEDFHIPPSPLSSAPNTPNSTKSDKRYGRSILLSDSETETDPLFKGPPRVSRQLLPPSMRSPTFSKLPSSVSNPQQHTWSDANFSTKKKKKSFMKKRDVPFDENPISMPKLKFSSTERTLRMLKGESSEMGSPPTQVSATRSTASSRYSLDAPHDEVSPAKKKQSSVASIEEAPDDEKGAMMRNILAEMDEMEDNIIASKSGDSEEISWVASSKNQRGTSTPQKKKNSAGIPMEITLGSDSGIPPPKRPSPAKQQDELMRSVSTKDELMESTSSKRDEIMNGADESMMSTNSSQSSPTKSSSSNTKTSASVAASASAGTKTSPAKQPQAKPVVAEAATPKTSSPTKTEAPPQHQSMTEMALSWLTPSAAVATTTVVAAKSKPSPDLAVTEIRLDAMETKIDKNSRKIQNQVSRDLVLPEEVEDEITFNTMLGDAAYFSSVAATTLAAAGQMAVTSLNNCETDAAAEAQEQVSKQPKTPEEIAAEWRQKRKAMEARRSELVYDSSPYSYLTDNAFAASSEDDDDKTQVAKNHLIDDLREDDRNLDNANSVASIGAIGTMAIKRRGDELGPPPPPPAPSRSGSVSSTSSGVTGWWLEKELARREREHNNKKANSSLAKSGSPLVGERRKSGTRLLEADTSLAVPSAAAGMENVLVDNSAATIAEEEQKDSAPDCVEKTGVNLVPSPVLGDGNEVPQEVSSDEEEKLVGIESASLAPTDVETEVQESADTKVTNSEDHVEEGNKEQEAVPSGKLAATASAAISEESSIVESEVGKPTASSSTSEESPPIESDDSEKRSSSPDAVVDGAELVAEQENTGIDDATLIGTAVVASVTTVAATIVASSSADSFDASIEVDQNISVETVTTAAPKSTFDEDENACSTDEFAASDVLAASLVTQEVARDPSIDTPTGPLAEDIQSTSSDGAIPPEPDLAEVQSNDDKNAEAKIADGMEPVSSSKSDDTADASDVASVGTEILSNRTPALEDVVDASDIASDGTEVLSNKAPILIKPIDDVNGICKGDVLLSLVHTKGVGTKTSTSGASQVRNAVWRTRIMRRRFTLREPGQLASEPVAPGSPVKAARPQLARTRSSLPVDVDDMRVVGGKNQTQALESRAIEHLWHDEFEDAVELYDDIYHAYKETFKQRNWYGGSGIVGNGELDTKQYLGNALHSMGVCHFLNHDYTEALSAFEKAAENRKSLDGAPSSDELTTLVKIALCHHALDDFSKSHKQLETCLESAKRYCKTITDFIQIAEILNNLGCLSFMGGEHKTAMKMFTESLDVQEAILSHSLYGGSVLAGHSTNLNISITRANVAFLKLCAEDHLAAILSFEAALSTQQMLLNDAHETLIGTMDHLAAANLLGGNKEKALNMLERMFRAQASAYGANDPRCENTKNKIGMVTSNAPKVKLPDENSEAKSKASSKVASKASSKGSSKSGSKTSSRSSSSDDGSNSISESGKDTKAQQKRKTPKLLRKLSTTFLKTQGMMMRQPSNGGANLVYL